MDLTDRYIAARIDHGRCMEIGDFKRGNAAFDRMIAALEVMRGHADKGESILIKLLPHSKDA